jgi:P-type Ca2+ transporter type 2C
VTRSGSSPIFPYLGWIFLGWTLTWAAVQLNMLQQLLDTVSLTGKQWGVVLVLSLIAPGIVWVDKTIHLAHLRKKEAAIELVDLTGIG